MGTADLCLGGLDLGTCRAQGDGGLTYGLGVAGEEALTLACLGRVLRREDEEHRVDMRVDALELNESGTIAQEERTLTAVQTADVP